MLNRHLLRWKGNTQKMSERNSRAPGTHPHAARRWEQNSWGAVSISSETTEAPESIPITAGPAQLLCLSAERQLLAACIPASIGETGSWLPYTRSRLVNTLTHTWSFSGMAYAPRPECGLEMSFGKAEVRLKNSVCTEA